MEVHLVNAGLEAEGVPAKLQHSRGVVRTSFNTQPRSPTMMMRLIAAAAVFVGSMTPVQEGPKAVDLIPRDVLFGNPERAAPQISPNGKLLAWIAPDQGVLNVWVRSLGGTSDDRVVTSDRK